MLLSIIVPTFNRVRSLERLLHSLEQLEHLDSIAFEVLIVDNGSTDGTRNLLVEHKRKPLRYRLQTLYESQPGQSAAINCGLRTCGGEIICLLDDDVVLDSRWLKGIVNSYNQTNFDAIQGRVLAGTDPSGSSADPKKLYYYNIPIVDEGEEIKPRRGLTGANMTFKRAVFEKIGFFDVRLGPGASGFSGDTDFSLRTRAAGFTIGYSPYPVVYHQLDPNRYGRKYNRMVEYRKGISRSIYRQDSIGRKVLPVLLANCIRYGLYRTLGASGKAYKTEGRIMKCWGYLVGKMRCAN